MYIVIPEEKNPSLYLAHIQGFTGRKNVLVQKVDVKRDNESVFRKRLNRIFETLKNPLFT